MDFPVDSVHKVTISIRLSLPTCLPSFLPPTPTLLPSHSASSRWLPRPHAVGRINFIYIVKWFNCLTVDLVLEFQTAKLIVWFVAANSALVQLNSRLDLAAVRQLYLGQLLRGRCVWLWWFTVVFAQFINKADMRCDSSCHANGVSQAGHFKPRVCFRQLLSELVSQSVSQSARQSICEAVNL